MDKPSKGGKTKFLNLRRRSKLLVLLLALIGVDQLTKFLAVKFLRNKPSVPILGNFLVLDFVRNEGVAFGILKQQRTLVLIITFVVLLVLAAVLFSDKLPQHKFAYFSALLLISGGLGNALDRFFRRYVVDFISFEKIGFPVFNIADCFVVVGAAMFMIYILFFYGSESHEKADVSPLQKTEALENDDENYGVKTLELQNGSEVKEEDGEGTDTEKV